MTYKEACEYIVETQKIIDPNYNKTWEQVFNYSPTGELFMINIWLEDAKRLREVLPKVDKEKLKEYIAIVNGLNIESDNE